MTGRSLQHALSKRNREAYDAAIENLRLVVRLFKSMKVPGGSKCVQTHITIANEAIINIQDYLRNECGYDCVLVGRFLQDLVENMFSIIRSQRPNTSAFEFKQRLRQISIARLSYKVKGSSYDFDARIDPVDLLLSSRGECCAVQWQCS